LPAPSFTDIFPQEKGASTEEGIKLWEEFGQDADLFYEYSQLSGEELDNKIEAVEGWVSEALKDGEPTSNFEGQLAVLREIKGYYERGGKEPEKKDEGAKEKEQKRNAKQKRKKEEGIRRRIRAALKENILKEDLASTQRRIGFAESLMTEAMETITVTVPEGAEPDQTLQVQSPTTGQPIQVEVPKGVEPGQEFQAQIWPRLDDIALQLEKAIEQAKEAPEIFNQYKYMEWGDFVKIYQQLGPDVVKTYGKLPASEAASMLKDAEMRKSLSKPMRKLLEAIRDKSTSSRRFEEEKMEAKETADLKSGDMDLQAQTEPPPPSIYQRGLSKLRSFRESASEPNADMDEEVDEDEPTEEEEEAEFDSSAMRKGLTKDDIKVLKSKNIYKVSHLNELDEEDYMDLGIDIEDRRAKAAAEQEAEEERGLAEKAAEKKRKKDEKEAAKKAKKEAAAKALKEARAEKAAKRHEKAYKRAMKKKEKADQKMEELKLAAIRKGGQMTQQMISDTELADAVDGDGRVDVSIDELELELDELEAKRTRSLKHRVGNPLLEDLQAQTEPEDLQAQTEPEDLQAQTKPEDLQSRFRGARKRFSKLLGREGDSSDDEAEARYDF